MDYIGQLIRLAAKEETASSYQKRKASAAGTRVLAGLDEARRALSTISQSKEEVKPVLSELDSLRKKVKSMRLASKRGNRSASRGRYGVVIEGPHIRFSMSKQGNKLKLEELPGKPVKRKVRYMVAEMSPATRWGGSRFLAVNLFRDAKISSRMTFDQALQALESAFEEAVQDTGADVSDPFFVRTRSYLEVIPTDAGPFEMEVDGNHLVSEWTSFEYTIRHNDDLHDPSYMKYVSTSPASARKLYKILRANPNAIRGDFKRFLDKNKIKYRVQNSVWR